MRQFTLLIILFITGLSQIASAQNRSISGRVTDRANNQGLPGVTVLVKGTTIGTGTNNDGTFTLSVPTTATTLVFSFIGYTTVEQPIGSGTINVGLVSDAKQIGEVVVTGALGIQRQEREVGYATATLDTKEITQARPTNFVNGLAGKVSGLQIQTLNNGVNSVPRVTLRGTRSLTGNNEALIVIDGVITSNEVLGALNPDDIASTSILKGANAAALYGSQASNGALIITTKKGNAGAPQVTFSHTSQFESISFLPKFQTEFGPGSPDWYNNSKNAKAGIFFNPGVNGAPGAPDVDYGYQYQGFENQQYGPRFDGSPQSFGYTLPDGTTQTLTYEARPNERKKFFNTGYQMQNGVSFAGGDEKSKFFASYQNVHNNGIVPKDLFDRNSFRFNASRELGRLNVGFNLSYSYRKADVTSNLDQNSSVYWNVFNTSVMAPLTSYKDYVNNPYATSDYGYYNAYYYNPYFIIDYNRTRDKRSTFQGDINASFKVTDWLRVQYRLGTTSTAQQSLVTQNKYTLAGDSPKQIAPYPGFYRDLSSDLMRINSDLFVSADKTFGDFNVKAILGNNVQVLDSRYQQVASTALAVPAPTDQINLSNRIGNLDGFSGRFTTHLYAFYADLTLGYKDFLFIHGSGRNDNTSVLAAGNRSFFYPGVDASFIFSNAIPALRDVSFLDYGKIRAGFTKVSQINLTSATGTGVAETGGAYQLNTVYNSGSGFPFGSVPSFTTGGALVQSNLKPEETRSAEAGIELSFFKRSVGLGLTYYNQHSVNQTINTTIPYSTGFQNLLLNAGEVKNEGFEADLNITPVRLQSGLTVTLGANFNYNNNEVLSLPAATGGILTLGGSGTTDATTLVAVPGMSYPQIQGTFYQRVEDGPAKGLVKMTKVSDPNDASLVRYVPLKDPGTKLFGNTQPKYKYGFNANISYKGLTLSGQAELRTGYVIYNGIGSDLDFTGGGARSATYGRQDFVYPNSAIPTTDASGTITGYTANTGASAVKTPGGSEFWANNTTWNRGISENYVTSGTFFKIREVSLSYTIPTSIASKIGLIKGASVNFFGRNIFTWVPKENIYTDPEFSATAIGSNAVGINTNLQTPPTKFYGATLNVTL
jgi:TonB-linked SusC/RagA family outer membrane protein